MSRTDQTTALGTGRETPGEGRWMDDPYDLEALAELEDELDVKVSLIEEERCATTAGSWSR